MAEVKYLVFLLGNQKYGVRLSVIDGIERTYNVVPVPLGAKHIKGIIHLRDTIVPLFDIKSNFEITEDADIVDRQLLITETHGIKLGIEVDNVVGIVPVDDADIKTIPIIVKTNETGYLENVVKITENGKTEIIMTISVDDIMSDRDFENVSDALNEVASEDE
ncbi:MAG: chemotaxis protein CheW [Clostridium sp.]|nr:chemotaxis protein CheW [Clostridium sp.]